MNTLVRRIAVAGAAATRLCALTGIPADAAPGDLSSPLPIRHLRELWDSANTQCAGSGASDVGTRIYPGRS